MQIDPRAEIESWVQRSSRSSVPRICSKNTHTISNQNTQIVSYLLSLSSDSICRFEICLRRRPHCPPPKCGEAISGYKSGVLLPETPARVLGLNVCLHCDCVARCRVSLSLAVSIGIFCVVKMQKLQKSRNRRKSGESAGASNPWIWQARGTYRLPPPPTALLEARPLAPAPSRLCMTNSHACTLRHGFPESPHHVIALVPIRKHCQTGDGLEITSERQICGVRCHGRLHLTMAGW